MLAVRPLFFLSIALMAGIAASGYLSHPQVFAIILGVLSIALLLFVPRVAPIAALIGAAAVGVLRLDAASMPAANDVSGVAPASIARVEGYVSTDPDVRGDRVTFRLSAIRVAAHGMQSLVSGDVAVTVSGVADWSRLGVGDGDHVELTGELYRPDALANPGAGSWAEHLARQGVRCAMRVARPNAVAVLPGGRPNWFRHTAWATRAALLRGLRATLPSGDAAVMAGVLLGLRADLPPLLLAAFVATGTIHILATAGLHVGILYHLVMKAMELLTVNKKLAAATTIGGIWLYDLMAGGRMAVTRAAIMATIYLFAVIVERTPDVLNSLGAAALAILVAEPNQLFEAGFQTSFGAVLVIAVLMPVWNELWDEPLHKIRGRFTGWAARKASELTGLTIFAQMGASPVLASTFNIVSLTGSIANLIVVPLLFILIPTGLAIAAVGLWWPEGGEAVARFTIAPIIHFIVWIVSEFSRFPGAEIVIASPPAWVAVAFYALVAGVFLRVERRILRPMREDVQGTAS